MNGIYSNPPQNWLRRQLKSTICGPSNGAWGGDLETSDIDVRCIRVADFDWPHLSIHSRNPTTRSYDLAQYRRLALQSGDLIIEKSGGGEKTPVGRVVEFNSTEQAVTSNFVARMRVKSGNHQPFIKYLFAAHYMSGFTRQFIKQATGIQNLDDFQYMQSACWLPPFDEQRAIAGYLDRETARIDGLIEKKDRFIALLKEKRAAVITHAVTKGVENRDDGISLPKLGYFIRPMASSGTIKNTVSVEPAPGLYPGYSASGQDVWVEKPDFDGTALVVSAVGARCGKTFLAHGKWGAIANTSVLRFLDGDPKFFWYLTNQPNFWEIGGAAQPYVKISESLQKRLFIPPIEAQVAIATYLDRETARIDSLITKTEQSIALLKEKRAALITAAVTGKIDVRSAA